MPATVHLYPEAYNQLVIKLSREHRDLWRKVGWYMAYDQAEFIAIMNKELDCLCLPEQSITEVCDKYLRLLGKRIGKQAAKSTELLAAEKSGKFGAEAIFGNKEDFLERKEFQDWQRAIAKK